MTNEEAEKYVEAEITKNTNIFNSRILEFIAEIASMRTSDTEADEPFSTTLDRYDEIVKKARIIDLRKSE